MPVQSDNAMSQVFKRGALLMAAALVGCAASSVRITGPVRAAISPEAVRIYTFAPAHFEEIAVLNASRRTVTAGGEKAIDKVIEEMQAEAAKLGANGLLLEDFSDAQSLTLGTGVGSDTYTHNGSISLGVAGAIGMVKKTAKGRAIFIAPP
jgi:uncharacterized protein YbjQ (UPF0145 family)